MVGHTRCRLRGGPATPSRGAPNAGLMIDVWHFYNGGAKLDVLDDLPGAGVAAVQLNDGPLVDGDFLKHARAQRTLPGEGELDVVGLIRAVQATGSSGPYCVEVNTPDFAHYPWTRLLGGPLMPRQRRYRRPRGDPLPGALVLRTHFSRTHFSRTYSSTGHFGGVRVPHGAVDRVGR